MFNNADGRDFKYVFVCGMPRSGTSILGRNIARMEGCTGLHDTGVLEDEGRYLQDVYPTEGECGGPGRFGFNPRTHLTETSPLLTPDNALKLPAELGTILGRKQGNSRGENSCEPSHDTVSTSGVSQCLFYSH